MYSNNTTLNLLTSFAYAGGSKNLAELVQQMHKSGRINLMYDSGAISLFNNAKGKKFISLESYCEWLQHFGNDCDKYIMLDKIRDTRQTKQNYEYMISKGLKPMFVFTIDDTDFDYLNSTLKNNRNICIAGCVKEKGGWMVQRFQNVYKHTDCKALIHGLGYVTYPNSFRLNLTSIDSTTWNDGQKYGLCFYFKEGVKRIVYKWILEGKQKFPIEVLKLFDLYEITPKDYINLDNHRGSLSIDKFLSMIAYLRYQEYAKINGVRLFLSVSSGVDVRHLLFLKETKNLTYEKFKKYANDYC